MSYWQFLRMLAKNAWHTATEAAHRVHLYVILFLGILAVLGPIAKAKGWVDLPHVEESTLISLPLLAVVCYFFWALSREAYRAFRDEHDKRVAAEQKTASEVAKTMEESEQERKILVNQIAEQRTLLDARLPKLSGNIDQVALGLPHDDSPTVAATFLVSIRNMGEPSIAEGWTIYAILDDARRIDGPLEWIDNQQLFLGRGPSTILTPGQPTEQPTMTLTSEDALYTKAIRQPIPRGGKVTGYLLAIFHGISREELKSPGARIVIEFHDVEGRSYSCDVDWNNLDIRLGAVLRYPGVNY